MGKTPFSFLFCTVLSAIDSLRSWILWDYYLYYVWVPYSLQFLIPWDPCFCQLVVQIARHWGWSIQFIHSIQITYWIFSVCAPPSLVGAYYLHPPDARALFLQNDLPCNGTWSVTGGGGGKTYWGHKRKRSHVLFSIYYLKSSYITTPFLGSGFCGTVPFFLRTTFYLFWCAIDSGCCHWIEMNTNQSFGTANQHWGLISHLSTCRQRLQEFLVVKKIN